MCLDSEAKMPWDPFELFKSQNEIDHSESHDRETKFYIRTLPTLSEEKSTYVRVWKPVDGEQCASECNTD